VQREESALVKAMTKIAEDFNTGQDCHAAEAGTKRRQRAMRRKFIRRSSPMKRSNLIKKSFCQKTRANRSSAE